MNDIYKNFITPEILEKFARFFVVGGISFGIDFCTTYLCKERFKFNKYIANTTGFLVGAVFNFTANKMWTYQNTDMELSIQLGKFLTVALTALLMNNIIIYIMNDKMKFNFYISKITAVTLLMFFNFIMNLKFTFG
jgi:putative flippase GtrA